VVQAPQRDAPGTRDTRYEYVAPNIPGCHCAGQRKPECQWNRHAESGKDVRADKCPQTLYILTTIQSEITRRDRRKADGRCRVTGRLALDRGEPRGQDWTALHCAHVLPLAWSDKSHVSQRRAEYIVMTDITTDTGDVQCGGA
jgi:hypothetical protein